MLMVFHEWSLKFDGFVANCTCHLMAACLSCIRLQLSATYINFDGNKLAATMLQGDTLVVSYWILFCKPWAIAFVNLKPGLYRQWTQAEQATGLDLGG